MAKTESVCPVCNRSVSSEIHTHVERCLRRSTSSSSPVATYVDCDSALLEDEEVKDDDNDEEEEFILDSESASISSHPIIHKRSHRGSIPDEDDDDDDGDDISRLSHSKQRKKARKTSSGERQIYVRREEDEDVVDVSLSYKDDWERRRYQKRLTRTPSHETAITTSAYGARIFTPSFDKLFDYQKVGLKWLYGLYEGGLGGILGDEMGLGKTVQLACHLDSITQTEKAKHGDADHLYLIVCPATLMQHWLSELHIWAPSLRVVIMHSISETFHELQQLGPGTMRKAIDKLRKESQGAVLIISYEGLRVNISSFGDVEWTAVCLDEGQKIRNPDAEITSVCKRLRAFHRIILSGTPIQNSLRELWSLFDFIYPGKLGSLEVFENEISTPIRGGGYKNAGKFQAELGVRTAMALQNLIKPHLLRRKKEDLKDVTSLTNKSEKILFCKLSSRQRAMYLEVINSKMIETVLKKKSTYTFKAISILRKLCNHPDMISKTIVNGWKEKKNTLMRSEDTLLDCDEDNNDDEEAIDLSTSNWEDSGKLIILSKLLQIWKQEGDKVLIFSQSQALLNLLETMLRVSRYRFLRLDGSTPVSRRQNLISSFNSDESIFAMILTTKTGGVGISLTGANRVVILDPDWNPQVDLQARERSWRIGQQRDVCIYRLITKGTIEEKIYERQIFKILLSNRILQNAKQKALFTRSDFKELFELRDDNSYDLPAAGTVDESDLNKSTMYKDDSTTSKDSRVLQALFDGSDICAVYDHNFLENVIMNNILEDANSRAANQIVEKAKAKLTESAVQRNPFHNPGESIQYSVLQRLKEVFEDDRILSSQQVLLKFGDISTEYAPIFREMLRRVATLRNGKWFRND